MLESWALRIMAVVSVFTGISVPVQPGTGSFVKYCAVEELFSLEFISEGNHLLGKQHAEHYMMNEPDGIGGCK